MNRILPADVWLFEQMRQLVGRYGWLDWIWKVGAVYLIYTVPIVLVAGWFWSSHTKRVAFRAGLAGIFAWEVVCKIIASLVNRPRPDVALVGVHELIFHRPDTSFPSDHAAMIFAVAMTVRLSGHRKLGNALFVIGTILSICRVMVGVHYPLDVIAGAAIGLLTGLAFYWLRKPIDKYLTEPFVKLMSKVKL